MRLEVRGPRIYAILHAFIRQLKLVQNFTLIFERNMALASDRRSGAAIRECRFCALFMSLFDPISVGPARILDNAVLDFTHHGPINAAS